MSEIDADRLDKDACREVLDEARDYIKVQLSAADSLATKVSSVLGQATTLALAAFGAATLAVPVSPATARWLPTWAGIGLAAGALVWTIGAVYAVIELRPRSWLCGFSPTKLWVPEVLTPDSSAEAYAFIASNMQQVIEHNDDENTRLATKLLYAQRLLIGGLVAGPLVAGLAFAAFALARSCPL